jgi:hypothetical protein
MLNSYDEDTGALIKANGWPELEKLLGAIRLSIDGVELIVEKLSRYETALRRIIHEQPDGAGAEIAKVALRHFGMH